MYLVLVTYLLLLLCLLLSGEIEKKDDDVFTRKYKLLDIFVLGYVAYTNTLISKIVVIIYVRWENNREKEK